MLVLNVCFVCVRNLLFLVEFVIVALNPGYGWLDGLKLVSITFSVFVFAARVPPY